jgi:hypothetical protein
VIPTIVTRYWLQRHIPPCWWRHGAHVEELSALFIAWRGVMEIPDRPNSWTIWHEELTGLLNRLHDHWNTGCTPDHHTHTPQPGKNRARRPLARRHLDTSVGPRSPGGPTPVSRHGTLSLTRA